VQAKQNGFYQSIDIHIVTSNHLCEIAADDTYLYPLCYESACKVCTIEHEETDKSAEIVLCKTE